MDRLIAEDLACQCQHLLHQGLSTGVIGQYWNLSGSIEDFVGNTGCDQGIFAG